MKFDYSKYYNQNHSIYPSSAYPYLGCSLRKRNIELLLNLPEYLLPRDGLHYNS